MYQFVLIQVFDYKYDIPIVVSLTTYENNDQNEINTEQKKKLRDYPQLFLQLIKATTPTTTTTFLKVILSFINTYFF